MWSIFTGLGSRVFLAPWSRSWSRLKKKPGAGADPPPQKKKTGAGVAKNMPLLYRLLDDNRAGARAEPHVFGPLKTEPKRLEKKWGAGAAWKKQGASPAFSIGAWEAGLGSRSRSRVFWLLGAGAAWRKKTGAGAAWKKSKFLWLNKQLFYLFYIFCSFTLTDCGEKNILPNFTNSQEPEPVFLAPWSRSRSKKYQELEP